ncbi:hypothetical protein A9HBioS_1503 [Pseudomonas koreensis]|uniref:Uncharacterized protein n=2 Tax=Pseudomonas koreensis TaxID=198620 RepID=A0AA94JII9_9PSED|nr:hypothetical protein A9HBioS_1503 [Pseudomonas koreensis]
MGCMGMLLGCVASPPNSFTFTADLPPGFVYQAIAKYEPDIGETCSVPDGRNTAVGYNLQWRENYVAVSEIAIRRTVRGCPLVIRKIDLEIYFAYGKDRGDFASDYAAVAIRGELEEKYKGTFDETDESRFYGQCQWLFRTMGPYRRIVKLLDCKKTDELGAITRGRPFAAYTLDQLPGRTVRMKIDLAAEERPAIGKTWVKVPNGWKRCMGDNFEDQYAFCFGNHIDFSTFQMVDGRICTIYPGCTE